ncbi:1-acyl-sn-glycerol-3-phosphate acyltransferase [Rubrivirga sp. IMCC43871]|uniref:1-acyl-sn-glycerol-3-phosphate acyltransferase n=1 Tax=Rubrivirga sp. IMCC43871 TaxID=3391575 RepID=UPI0039901069
MSARPDGLGARLARRFAERSIRGELAALRRVVGVDAADPAPGRPLVLYANHHVYPDSFLLWHLTTQGWRRPMVVWMEAWDRAPLFGPVGALPFPDDPGSSPGQAARRRMRTIRETARRMTDDPKTALYLYPEGKMRVPEDGLGPFAADLPRLARVLPASAQFVPVGITTSWWGESRPTAVLAVGDAHQPDGDEPARLAAMLARARAARPDDLGTTARVLLDGRPGADERWDLSRLAPLFERWTFPR